MKLLHRLTTVASHVLPELDRRLAHPLLFPTAFLLLFYGLLTGLIGLHAPLHGDERHFVDTIRLFAENFALRTSLDYPEVTPPLFYYLFAGWSLLFGPDIATLRILQLLLSLATWLGAYLLLRHSLQNPLRRAAAFVLLLVNPYAAGLSLYVFTDMAALLCVVFGFLLLIRRHSIGAALCLAAALLIRQYTVLFLLAAAAWQSLRIADGKARLYEPVLLLMAILPLTAYMLLWGGIAPPSGLAYWSANAAAGWHASYVTTYLTFAALYTLPFLLHRLRSMHWKEGVIVALASAVWYTLFPVRASAVTLAQTPLDTVGLAHRGLRLLLPPPPAEHVLLYALFTLGCLMIYLFVREELARRAWEHPDLRLLLTITLISFVVVMPFSYQVWEKYLVLILPFLVIRLLLPRSEVT